MNCIGYTTPSKKQYMSRKVYNMKYTKYTVLAMSALVLGTVGTKAVQAANASHPTTTSADSQDAIVQKATDAVNALYADKDHTELADGVTTLKIMNAQSLVTKISFSNSNYDKLYGLCKKARTLLSDNNPAIKEAEKVVNALFTDDTHTKLASGVTGADIMAAERVVIEKVPVTDSHYMKLFNLCNDAAALLNSHPADDEGLAKATAAVNALFADSDHTKLASGVTTQKIVAAEALVHKYVKGDNYTKLISLCNRARILLRDNSNNNPSDNNTDEVKAATKAVNALFFSSSHISLATGVTEAQIDAAEKLVAKIPTSNPNYAKLRSLCDKARDLLKTATINKDVAAAKKAVNALFTTSYYTNLASGVTEAQIDAAKALVAKIPTDNENYKKLNDLCEKAEKMLADDQAAVKAATKAVDALYADKDHTKLAAGVTMKQIDAAEKLADKILTTDANRSKLLKLCDKAEKLLKATINSNVTAAKKAVNALFTNDYHNKLAPGVTEAQINAAKALVAKIPTDNGNYKSLNDLCDKAAKMLAENTDPAVTAAEKAVNALFTDNKYNKLAPGVTAEKIAAAKKLVEKIPQSNSNYKTLLTRCEHAQTLLDEANTESKIQEAVAAVNALFADASQNSLADSTNSAKIDAARELVKKNVPVYDYRYSTLMNLCSKAERLAEKSTTIRPASSEGEQKAIDAVKALFSDDTYTKLSDKANSALLQKARDLIDQYVKPGNSNFVLLYELCQKAEGLINQCDNILPAASPEEQALIDEVNALFTDDSHTKLADGIDRDQIMAVESKLYKTLGLDNRNTYILYDLCVKALGLLK